MAISRRALFAATSALAAFFLPSKTKAETLDEAIEKPERRLQSLRRDVPVPVECNSIFDLVLMFAPEDLEAGDPVYQSCTDGSRKPVGATLSDVKKGEPCFVAIGMFP